MENTLRSPVNPYVRPAEKLTPFQHLSETAHKHVTLNTESFRNFSPIFKTVKEETGRSHSLHICNYRNGERLFRGNSFRFIPVAGTAMDVKLSTLHKQLQT
jgi:hypothetical protein